MSKSDYQLIHTALDHAHGAYENDTLHGLLDKLREDTGKKLSAGSRRWAQEIVDRGMGVPPKPQLEKTNFASGPMSIVTSIGVTC